MVPGPVWETASWSAWIGDRELVVVEVEPGPPLAFCLEEMTKGELLWVTKDREMWLSSSQHQGLCRMLPP